MAAEPTNRYGLLVLPVSPDSLSARFRATRNATVALIADLEPEDLVVQAMPDASPLRWHLGHTTWFFDVFVLEALAGQPVASDPRYRTLFNSYYQGVGVQWERSRRGILSRPTRRTILQWRDRVDDAVAGLLADPGSVDAHELYRRVELGIHHEQQHQELMVTDLKAAFGANPLAPVYREAAVLPTQARTARNESAFVEVPEGIRPIGHGGDAFAFDCELPRHDVLLRPARVARDLITCGQYLEFVQDGGYERHDLWLSDGWDAVRRHGWRAPEYWRRQEPDGDWVVYTLAGERALAPNEPVAHVSLYEADAYARWRGARLPLEAEWEVVVTQHDTPAARGVLLEDGAMHPVGRRVPDAAPLAHAMGEVWEWTASAYLPYPGFRPLDGALGEYNGKFMNGQRVLRGASCATATGHSRPTYRNFFQPDKRWQFTGIRLAWDA